MMKLNNLLGRKPLVGLAGRLMMPLLLLTAADSFAQSAIYACGHIRRQRETAIDLLRNSGYKTAILFNINVEDDGTLTTDFTWSTQTAAEAGGIICQNGEYVFDQWQPHWVEDVNALLEPPATINRIEICIGGWGNGSYGHIADFIEENGCGPETALYRNFKALKEVLPCIDAVNNDQEQDYDVEAAVAFHRMLAEIGFKTTLAPYTRMGFWRELCSRLNKTPGTVDRVYLQTYGGGSGNNPADWQVFGDVPMYVGYDAEASPALSSMEMKFKRFRDQGYATGGFIWNYNSENIDQREWASAINAIFVDNGSTGVGSVHDGGLSAICNEEGLSVAGIAGDTLRIFDAQGILVAELPTGAAKELSVNASRFNPGLYIVTDGGKSVKCRICR